MCVKLLSCYCRVMHLCSTCFWLGQLEFLIIDFISESAWFEKRLKGAMVVYSVYLIIFHL